MYRIEKERFQILGTDNKPLNDPNATMQSLKLIGGVVKVKIVK